ncbi:MAG TPA: Crp/Fnr family transcriptional regulator [Chitinophaga sp.]|uniref:Crp/Fnr family transcriptional regulator n=1 Tax=Chitinophaga sp. TaxID=1869181 RepID=UPI002CF2B9E4|nr:Crp/Fnr family transcriptional regulator [Chitinophaga sp.]HVI48600.1 Crp/Fnr family transcriptional regulator [Chitinophaga sp.]
MYNLDTMQQQLETMVPESRQSWPQFSKILHPVGFAAGEYLSQPGKVADAIFYITSGIVRACLMYNDKDISLDFAFPGNFTSSYASFIRQAPAEVGLQAIGDVTGYAFYHDDIHGLYDTCHICERMGRAVAEQQYLRKYQRELSFLQYSAQERYLQLLAEHPEVVQYISIKQIASFLGIEPESLSRIRKNIRS